MKLNKVKCDCTKLNLICLDKCLLFPNECLDYHNVPQLSVCLSVFPSLSLTHILIEIHTCARAQTHARDPCPLLL